MLPERSACLANLRICYSPPSSCLTAQLRKDAPVTDGKLLPLMDMNCLGGTLQVHILKAAFVLQHLLVTHFSDGLVNADTFILSDQRHQKEASLFLAYILFYSLSFSLTYFLFLFYYHLPILCSQYPDSHNRVVMV
jgi:hypothetical protein